jgi:hypothetical protein
MAPNLYKNMTPVSHTFTDAIMATGRVAFGCAM